MHSRRSAKLGRAIVWMAVAVGLPAWLRAASPRSPATQPAVLPVSLAGDARQTQVLAAGEDAADKLCQQVRRTALSRSLTVGELVDRCQGGEALAGILQTARTIGGPRWIDDQTCQIRLQIVAGPVAEVLVKLAGDHSASSPMPADALRHRLRYWDRLTFFAVGSSTTGESVGETLPGRAIGVWASVSDDTRRAVLADARQNAVVQLRTELAPLPLPPTGWHLSDALGREPIRRRLDTLLNREPVTRVAFLENLHVQVTLAPSPRSLVADVFQAIDADPAWLSPTAVDWPQVERAVSARVSAGLPWVAVGDAAAPAAATRPVAEAGPDADRPAPDWIDRELVADSVAGGGGVAAPSLRLARTAETAARDQLRAQLLVLPLGYRSTIGDAARSSARIDAAVDRAMRCVHVVDVDCRADGSVHVGAALNLRDVWDALVTTP